MVVRSNRNPFGDGPRGGGGSGGGGGGFGGGVRFGPGVPMPKAVKTILLLNVGLFFLESLAGWNPGFINRTFGLAPQSVWGDGYVWQLVTYMFLHGGLMHLLFNMLMLWMFGSALEHAWGTRNFLPYYFVCGVGGGLLTCVVTAIRGEPSITIGASGAVLGLVLAYALRYPDRVILLFFVFPMKMRHLLWVLVLLDLWGSMQDNGTDNFAHLGGMFFGYLYLKQDWRLGGLSRKVRAARARAEMKRNTRRQESRDEQRRQIDAILEKIHRHGIDSLTEQEQRILREAKR